MPISFPCFQLRALHAFHYTQITGNKLILSWWNHPVIPLCWELSDCVERHGLRLSKFILLKFTAGVWPQASQPLSINSDIATNLKSIIQSDLPARMCKVTITGTPPTQCTRNLIIDPTTLPQKFFPTRWNSAFCEGPYPLLLLQLS